MLTSFGLITVLANPLRCLAQSCGDVDGTGAVTVTDGVHVLGAAAGLDTPCAVAPNACDVDGSGSITVTDGVAVLRSAANLATPLSCPPQSPAPTIVWDGEGDGVSWRVPLNWSPNRVPTTGDRVLIEDTDADAVQFDESAGTVSIESLVSLTPIVISGGSLAVAGPVRTYRDVTIAGGDLDVGTLGVVGCTVTVAGTDELHVGMLAVHAGATLVLNGRAHVGSLSVHRGGEVTHSAGETGFLLDVADDLVVDAGGAIVADALGHGSAQGPGAGHSDSVGQSSAGAGGAGHGGAGGTATTVGGDSYGSETCPAELGSGGGEMDWIPGGPTYCCTEHGGAGGGSISLNVGGRLVVDGILSANGGDATSACAYWGACWSGGGGSGGSIAITTSALAGSGRISASGGSGGVNGGGGGGGRIAIAYATFDFEGGPIDVSGGGPRAGGMGVLFSCEPGNGGCPACPRAHDTAAAP